MEGNTVIEAHIDIEDDRHQWDAGRVPGNGKPFKQTAEGELLMVVSVKDL